MDKLPATSPIGFLKKVLSSVWSQYDGHRHVDSDWLHVTPGQFKNVNWLTFQVSLKWPFDSFSALYVTVQYFQHLAVLPKANNDMFSKIHHGNSGRQKLTCLYFFQFCGANLNQEKKARQAYDKLPSIFPHSHASKFMEVSWCSWLGYVFDTHWGQHQVSGIASQLQPSLSGDDI